jgi:uncharacterized protein YbjT (DUF2867 family)
LSDRAPVLVIGGTRGTGRLIVERLERQNIRARVLARDSDAARTQLGASVEVVNADITKPETLPRAFEHIGGVVFTAGIRSGRPATDGSIRTTEYGGVINTLDAARHAGFTGRFLYMTASGVGRRSFASMALNIYKGNTLEWRLRAEDHIRQSALAYSIIRAGVLLNSAGGRHGIRVTQEALPLSLRYRIARADVADAFVAALDHPRTVRATFDVVWGDSPRNWQELFDPLRPDPDRP